MNVWDKTLTKLRNNPLTSGEWRKLVDRRGAPRRVLDLPVEIHVDGYPSNVRLRSQLRNLSVHSAALRKPAYPLSSDDSLTLVLEGGNGQGPTCAPLPATLFRDDDNDIVVLFDSDLGDEAQSCLAALVGNA